MLSIKQIQDVCGAGSGTMGNSPSKVCRYLHDETGVGGTKFLCLKLRKTDKANIDRRANDFIHECKRKNIDPTQEGVPLGDNCQGYPVLRTIEQGYDKP
jgi:hypothetical protein